MPSASKLPESNENKIPVTLRITGYGHALWPRRNWLPKTSVALYLIRRLRSQGVHDLNTVNYCT